MNSKLVQNKLLNRLKNGVYFDEFWEKYPRKQKYVEAYMAFKDALEKESADKILASLDSQISHKLQCVYPCADVWLNQEFWRNRSTDSDRGFD